MNEIHLTNIEYIEQNTEQLPFKYKPDVPKLKLYGNIVVMEDEEVMMEEEDEKEKKKEEGEKGILFLTQKQLNQIVGGKGIEIVSDDDSDKWYLKHPLKKEQIKQIGLVDIQAVFIGTAGDTRCYEVMEVKN